MMEILHLNKRKIINDPIYGFINIPDDFIFDIIEHPYFQRLRRIQQLGLTHLVYPGALHTRFHHAIGAMHLMVEAIETLKLKGHEISKEEEQGAVIAILLHDIGHGPFSHTLENNIVHGMNHEVLSGMFFNRLNSVFPGSLDIAIKIFNNEYDKKFLHQLVSSQLDVDRLDYLKRDSYYTGVSEGVTGTERIIKMLNVSDGNIVVEAKGIYSIEKFIVARRLMYWQVYLHKTVLSAEYLLVSILRRACMLASEGVELFSTPAFSKFLYNRYSPADFAADPSLLETFALLDDTDLLASIKVWTSHKDNILSFLSRSLINRHLPAVELSSSPFDEEYVNLIKSTVARRYDITFEDTSYLVFGENITNYAYNPDEDKIRILFRDGNVSDIMTASEQLHPAFLSGEISRFFLCYPKNCKP